ncbi:MAG: hypothetical protein KC620_01120, partial [Myxococcales bacterium]|nr:hypothetical protein [Myxococcales bacterium]
PVPAAPPVAAPPPPAAPARLVFGELEVEGGASTRAIRRTIQDAFPAIRRCASAGEPRPAGAEAKVSFVIDADGFFGDFGGSGDAVLVRCGRQVLTGVKRLGRRPDTGDIAVAVPMRMEAP